MTDGGGKETKKRSSEDGDDVVMLTSVTWEFGDVELFEKMASMIAMSCSINEYGHLILQPNGARLDQYGHLGPVDLAASVNIWRAKAIENTLKSVNSKRKFALKLS